MCQGSTSAPELCQLESSCSQITLCQYIQLILPTFLCYHYRLNKLHPCLSHLLMTQLIQDHLYAPQMHTDFCCACPATYLMVATRSTLANTTTRLRGIFFKSDANSAANGVLLYGPPLNSSTLYPPLTSLKMHEYRPAGLRPFASMAFCSAGSAHHTQATLAFLT